MATRTQAPAELVKVDFDKLLQQHDADDAPDLKSVLSTVELKRRPSRPPNHAAENRALNDLMQELATSPHSILRCPSSDNLRQMAV